MRRPESEEVSKKARRPVNIRFTAKAQNGDGCNEIILVLVLGVPK